MTRSGDITDSYISAGNIYVGKKRGFPIGTDLILTRFKNKIK